MGNLGSMAAGSTPIDVAFTNKQPTIIEFYRKSCTVCNAIAPRLAAVEKQAQADGINWVMLDTDDPASVYYYTRCGVDELPHFEFFAPDFARESAPIKGCGNEECTSEISARLDALK